MKRKQIAAGLLAGASLMGTLVGCSAPTASQSQEPAQSSQQVGQETAAPKYVFLFIGDGMSYPQIQSTADYLGALQDQDYHQAQPSLDDNQGAILDGPEYLNFMNFDVSGSAVTYDSNSFCPDSASTATSISTGHKTYSGTINMDETGSQAYETIAEKVKEQLGWKVGVVSSVTINHATPAAFYAHQASRNDYYEIGLDLLESGFDYFAGAGFSQPDGPDGDQENLYDLVENAGYTLADTKAEVEAITGQEEKVFIVDENVASDSAMNYELDRTDDMLSLADYVDKGIEVLDNDQGFFLMCEGGKIDWACHANDAASAIHETMAFADAVQVAVDFAQEHPQETLILVTGDHETGGMTIGFAGTDYDTYLDLLDSQKVSFTKFDTDYVAKYKENKTPFDQVMQDVEELFGLKTQGEEGDKLVLTDYEVETLKAAYEKSINGVASSEYEQEEYVLYGSYEPLTVTLTHLINNKAGVNFASYSHTGLPVAVLAQGAGSQQFDGYYDNTDIFHKMAALVGVK